jgi:hypothetical protein
MVAGVALDVLGIGKCSYFVIPTLADFSSVLRNVVIVTLLSSYSFRATPYTLAIHEELYIQPIIKKKMKKRFSLVGEF